MKRLDVKKLAAIGAGAALVGLALAPIAAALTKTDVLKGDNSPFDVVVGKNAAASDYLWAGNIAAKLAQLATEDTDVSCNVSGWKEGKGPTGTGSTAPCNGLSVDLSVGGTAKVTGDVESYDSLYLESYPGTTSELIAEMSNSQIGSLYKQTKTFRYANNSYSQTITEWMGVKADVQFDYTRTKLKDFVLYLDDEGDFNYRVNYSKGIPVDESTTDNTDFSSGNNDNVIVVLFGDEYRLYDADTTRASGAVSSVDLIKIVKTTGEKSYATSQTIDDLDGSGEYAGKKLKVRVDDVWDTSTAQFTLIDDEGNEVSTETVTAEGSYLDQIFYDSKSEYALATSLYVKTINFNAATGTGEVMVAKGGDLITLKNNWEYPYSATDTDETNDNWYLTFTTSTSSNPDANVITDITIKNKKKQWEYASDGSSVPVYAGNTWSLTDTGKAGSNEAVFLAGEAEATPGYGYAKVVFRGWKGDKSSTYVKIAHDNSVEFEDATGQPHKVPFYFELQDSSSGTFTIDTQTFYYKVDTTDVNFSVGTDNNTINGANIMTTDGNIVGDAGLFPGNNGATNVTATVDVNGVTYLCTPTEASRTFNCLADGNFQISTATLTSAVDADYIGTANQYNTWYYDDNTTIKTGATRATLPLSGSGTNSQTFKYVFLNRDTLGTLWLLLDASTNFSLRYSKDLNLTGTDTGEDGIINASYYLPDETDLGGDPATSTAIYVAKFGVMDNNTSTYDTEVYVDTRDGIHKLPAFPINELSTYGYDVNYHPSATESWFLTSQTGDSYMQKAYTDVGSKFEVVDNYFSSVLLQNPDTVYLTIEGSDTTTTLTGGTDFCTGDGCEYAPLEEGTEQMVGTTTYMVSKITCADCTCAAGGGVLPEDVAVSPSVTAIKAIKKIGSQIVFTDEEALGTNFVIVGGHLINSKATGAEFADGLTLADKLTSSGQTVVEATADGDWVVAGFTAKDTATAAKEFIGMLDAAFE